MNYRILTFRVTVGKIGCRIRTPRGHLPQDASFQQEKQHTECFRSSIDRILTFRVTVGKIGCRIRTPRGHLPLDTSFQQEKQQTEYVRSLIDRILTFWVTVGEIECRIRSPRGHLPIVTSLFHSENSIRKVWGSPVEFLGYGSHGDDIMIARWVVGYCGGGKHMSARCLAG